jgi:hypothetical protein
MAEASAVKQNGAKQENRNPMIMLQARFDALEAEARGRLVRALGAADEALHGLDDALARVSREDWTVEGMRRRIGGLRARAENLRTTAMKRVADMPGTAVSRLANGSRVPVQNLARELDRLAKRLEQARDGKARKPVEGAKVEKLSDGGKVEGAAAPRPPPEPRAAKKPTTV